MDGPISPQMSRLLDTVENLYLETIELTDEEFEDILQAILAEYERNKGEGQSAEFCCTFIDAVRSSRAGYLAIMRGEA